MIPYADTSFLVSLYVTDMHSADARARVVGAARLWCTPLHRAEWTHALAQHVFRGQLNSADFRKIEQDFEGDLKAGVWERVELPENSWDLCADLAQRYGAKFGTRTFDSLHVACALELSAERFWTFDDRQSRLAKAVGLKAS
ncbi:MAG TPA: type II toxin-antitoxin system VapC family toxin [Terriglobales bacterium]|nr:type II toxin-antitoxin system VapC family toxin [Terriglobales bacterium]